MIELLRKPNWNYKDVMAFVGCKKSKAYELLAKCNPSSNTRDCILSLIGTSVEREIYINNLIEKGGVK